MIKQTPIYSNSISTIFKVFILLTLPIYLISCGGSDNNKEIPGMENAGSGKEFVLVDNANIGAPNAELAAKGKAIFDTKCVACHKFDSRLVGPPLGDVVDRRSPEFILSMIIDPEKMLANNDTVKALLKQYMTPMTNQNVSLDDAKAIYEYLREYAKSH